LYSDSIYGWIRRRPLALAIPKGVLERPLPCFVVGDFLFFQIPYPEVISNTQIVFGLSGNDPVFAVGSYLRINLFGKRRTQFGRNDYYVVIRQVHVAGFPGVPPVLEHAISPKPLPLLPVPPSVETPEQPSATDDRSDNEPDYSAYDRYD
jgi:hypothetical protein